MNNTQKDTLIQLYQSSKAIALRTEKYQELNVFREEIEIVPFKTNRLPYTSAKSKVRLYQAIFITFALLFLALAYFVSATMNSYPFIFGAGAYFTARNLIYAFSLIAAVGAAGTAFLMTPGREAAGQIHRQALFHLRKHKQRKKMEWNLVEYFQWKICKKTNLLRDAHQDAREKLDEAHDETVHLLARIAKATISNEEKETLLNQALLEYGDKGRGIVRNFRKTKLPAALQEAPSQREEPLMQS